MTSVPKYIIIAWTIIGVPLKTFTYKEINPFNNFLKKITTLLSSSLIFISFIKAKIIPSNKPTKVPNKANIKVAANPSRKVVP